MNTEEKNKSPDELKQFGCTMALMCFILVFFSLWKHDFRVSNFSIIMFPIGLGFTFTSYLVPTSLRVVEKLWMAFGEKMGSIMTPIILSLSFFLIITPIGLLIRLLRRDLLQLKIDRTCKSYWIKTEQDGPASRPYMPY